MRDFWKRQLKNRGKVTPTMLMALVMLIWTAIAKMYEFNSIEECTYFVNCVQAWMLFEIVIFLRSSNR